MFEKITFSQFEFKLQAIDSIELPQYKGSTFRGVFGHALKRVSCILKSRECPDCPVRDKCTYIYLFETPPPKDASSLKNFSNIPHPFVILPPLEEKEAYEEGEEFSFTITLIGKAIKFLPYIVLAFEDIGKRGIGKRNGRFILKEVVNRRLNEEKCVYDGEEKILNINIPPLSLSDIYSEDKIGNRLEMKFYTPLRIKFKSRYTSDIEFHIIFRNLLRRLSNLAQFHCDAEVNLDFNYLISKAEKIEKVESNVRWQDWERFSFRQQQRMKLGGLVGSIIFEGNFIGLYEPLLLGEKLHIGKNTSFGLGKYGIDFVD